MCHWIKVSYCITLAWQMLIFFHINTVKLCEVWLQRILICRVKRTRGSTNNCVMVASRIKSSSRLWSLVVVFACLDSNMHLHIVSITSDCHKRMHGISSPLAIYQNHVESPIKLQRQFYNKNSLANLFANPQTKLPWAQHYKIT